MQPLDPWLVADGRVRERARARRLCRVLATLAVDEVEPLGLVVVGLEVVVGERPGRRDAAVVADLAEVALAEPEEDRAVELRLAADVVVLAGMERLSRPCRTTSRCVLYVLFDEDGAAVPVLGLAAQVVAALEQQDPLARSARAGRRACRRLRRCR